MQVPLKYATAVTLRFRVVKKGVIDLAVGSDWTPSAGDVKISQDGGALGNTANLPTNTPSGSRWWALDLTTGETTGQLIGLEIHQPASVEDQALDFYTYGNASAAIVRDLGVTPQDANVVNWAGTALATPDTVGYPKVTIKSGTGTGELSLAAGFVTVGTLAAAAIQSIWDALVANLTTVNSIGKKFKDWVLGSDNKALLSTDSQAGVTIPTVTTVGSVTNPVAITSSLKKNQALAKFPFVMKDSTTHQPVAGRTVTCTRLIDGGAFGAGTLANVTDVGNGTYTVDFGAGDLNGTTIVLRATAGSSDDTVVALIPQP